MGEVQAGEIDQAQRQLAKARWLWARRKPVEGSPAEIYLRDLRRYFGPIPATLGYLAPYKEGQHPALIAAFGLPAEPEPGVIEIDGDQVQGVHLTLLKRDGSGKAGTGRDKTMVGPSNGWPIVLAPPNDLLGLAVCEGIETGLSIFEATGLGVWAAGSASRFKALAPAIPDYVDCVTIAAELDAAGQAAAFGLVPVLNARGVPCELRSFQVGA